METSSCAKSTAGVIASMKSREKEEKYDVFIRQFILVFMTAPEYGGFE
jgi:hypothetical protein